MNKRIEMMKKNMASETMFFLLILTLAQGMAVVKSIETGICIGVAILGVLVISKVIMVLLGTFISDKIEFLVNLVVVAVVVTCLEFFMQAFALEMYESFGSYIPMIGINAAVLGNRKLYEKTDSLKEQLAASFLETVVIGGVLITGFLAIGIIREATAQISIMEMAPGAFFLLAFGAALVNHIRKRKEQP